MKQRFNQGIISFHSLHLLTKMFLSVILMQIFLPAFGQKNNDKPTRNKDSVSVQTVTPLTATGSSSLYLNQDKLYAPAPNAAELGRFSAVNVGLYTGTAQYSIPICEFKTTNMTIPITMNYSSNGLVVDKLASWAGFDWSLSAGGVINRYRKGGIDKPGTRIAFQNISSMTVVQKRDYFDLLLSNGSNDLQPDEFTFTFPGYSGKFVIDSIGNPTTLPYSNLKIETNTSGGAFSYFNITTPDGVVYKFDKIGYSTPPGESSYITSWFLSEITHPSGDVITFEYTTVSLDQYEGVVQKATAVVTVSGQNPNCGTSSMSENVNSVYVTTLFLNKISSTGHGSIEFEKKSRADSYADYRLRKITVKDNSANIIKKIVFYHQFPGCATSFNSKSNLLIAETNNQHTKRMFLDSIQVQSADSSRLNSYAFYYNNLTQLPARFNYAQDHWGYFNGKPNTDFAVKSEVPSNYQSFFSTLILTNADRTPVYTYSQNGMLQKIVFPTGGYTTIEYEANKNDTGADVGGCRVLRTKTYESATSNPEIRKYVYSNIQSSINYKYYHQYTVPYNDCYISYSCTYGVLSSNSFFNLTVNGMYHTLYGKVEILNGENGENGKEVHVFNTDKDAPGTPINAEGGNGQIYPLVMNNNGWKSGLLSSNYMADNNNTNVWKKDLVYNEFETAHRKIIRCMAVEKFCDSPCAEEYNPVKLYPYNVVSYTLNSIWYYINSETVTKYHPNGNVVTTKTYAYDSFLSSGARSNGHCLLSKETQTTSDGNTMEKRYYYPQDYGSSIQNFSTLINKRIINVPVDERTYKYFQFSHIYQIASGNQYKYNDFGQVVNGYQLEIPYGTYDVAFNSNNPYTFSLKKTIEYNSLNFIKKVIPQNNYSTYYLWDSTGKYLMATVEGGNVSWTSISPYDGLSCSTNSYTLWSNLNGAASNARINTFSYDPKYGMIQSTAPSGVRTNYGYDKFGRLEKVTNDDSQLLKEYKYHFRR